MQSNIAKSESQNTVIIHQPLWRAPSCPPWLLALCCSNANLSSWNVQHCLSSVTITRLHESFSQPITPSEHPAICLPEQSFSILVSILSSLCSYCSVRHLFSLIRLQVPWRPLFFSPTPIPHHEGNKTEQSPELLQEVCFGATQQ